jgi:septum formation protein
MPELILASSSPYRQALLNRLGIPFRSVSPGVDELSMPQEAPAELAARLAAEKALAISSRFEDAIIIGSDQVASLRGATLGKPGNLERAQLQLQQCSGQRVAFYTALGVYHGGRMYHAVDLFEVEFRELEPEEIDNYLAREQPFDCAGSFKWEGLGISLFERLSGDDPTSLEGLPLISLCRILRELDLNPLKIQLE